MVVNKNGRNDVIQNLNSRHRPLGMISGAGLAGAGGGGAERGEVAGGAR